MSMTLVSALNIQARRWTFGPSWCDCGLPLDPLLFGLYIKRGPGGPILSQIAATIVRWCVYLPPDVCRPTSLFQQDLPSRTKATTT
jgi:hypothetical protein